MNDAAGATTWPKKFRRISIALFLACLPFAAVCTNGACTPAVILLAFGGLAFWTGLANLAWLANVLLVVAWVKAQDGGAKAGLIAASLALTLGVLPMLSSTVVMNEGGVATEITGLGWDRWP